MKYIDNFWPWNTPSLILALRERRSVNEGLYGLCAYIIFCVMPFTAPPPSKSQLLYLTLETIGGFLLIYFFHEKKQGNDFLKKIICLSLPVTLRLIILSIILVILQHYIPTPSTNMEYQILLRHLFNLASIIYLGRLVMLTLKNGDL